MRRRKEEKMCVAQQTSGEWNATEGEMKNYELVTIFANRSSRFRHDFGERKKQRDGLDWSGDRGTFRCCGANSFVKAHRGEAQGKVGLFHGRWGERDAVSFLVLGAADDDDAGRHRSPAAPVSRLIHFFSHSYFRRRLRFRDRILGGTSTQ